MTTLWIFGDNYSAYWPNEIQESPEKLKNLYTWFNNENTWQNIVANNIDAEIKNYALGFSSIEYMFKKFNAIRDQIKENDTIIITVISPDISTRNFVRDNPQILTANTDFSKIKFHSPEKYISREDAFMMYLDNFLYNLKDITVKLNLNTIVIPSQKNVDLFLNNHDNFKKYEPITVAQGCLQEITFNEYQDDIKGEAWYFRDDSIIKTNWLTKSNHKILAEKITNTIKNREDINLTQDFVKGIIDSKNRKDIRFLSVEY